MPQERADYSKEYIYALASPDLLGVYVGSSALAMTTRMREHHEQLNATTARTILATGTAVMVKLYDFPCARIQGHGPLGWIVTKIGLGGQHRPTVFPDYAGGVAAQPGTISRGAARSLRRRGRRAAAEMLATRLHERLRRLDAGRKSARGAGRHLPGRARITGRGERD